MRFIQAKEIVTGHQSDMVGARQQIQRTQERNAMLEERLSEADDLIAQMSKLIESFVKNFAKYLNKLKDVRTLVGFSDEDRNLDPYNVRIYYLFKT